ncbi:MAG: D-alanyl-D-alanine carboxypeptidase [Lachnospiraceae bacterium]|nr:D-alanyl-D-alanine carboxypeptidase [Lachnospiraceae bacterium]
MKKDTVTRNKNKRKLTTVLFMLCLMLSNLGTVFAADSNVFKTQTTGSNDTTEEEKELTPEEKVEEARNSLEITAGAAILIDAASGQILYEKNPYDKKYPASITKVMTMLIALEHGVDITDIITMSEEAVWGFDRNSSHIALDVGEQITVEQCMYAIMLESANEASLALAEFVGGSIENFVAMMNEKAKELGCQNTNFVNPNGLFDENHYVCAYDMALITKEAIQYELFRTISSTSTYTISPTNKQPEERNLWNSNKMLRANYEGYYSYLEGGKTGYVVESKNTYVAFAKKGDVELICVILEADGAKTAYAETRALFDFGFNNYDFVEVAKEFSFISSSYTDTKDLIGSLTQKQLAEIVIDRESVALAPKGLDASYFNYEIISKEDLSMETEEGEDLFFQANGEGGVHIGNLRVYYEEQQLFELPIWTSIKEESTVNPADYTPKKKVMIHTVIRVLFLVILMGGCTFTLSTYAQRKNGM